MKTPKVSVYLRVSGPDGRRLSLKPFYANRRLKPLHGIVDKKPHHFPGGVYYLRYTAAGKPRWENAGSDAELIPEIVQRRKHALEGALLEQQADPSASPGESPVHKASQSNPEPDPEEAQPATRDLARAPIAEAVKTYLDEKEAHTRPRTYAAYANACTQFSALMLERKKKTLAQVDRTDMLAFAKALRLKGDEPRTVYNGVFRAQLLLHYCGLPSLLSAKKGDLPKFTRKKPRRISDGTLDRMFASATQDESDLLSFFLMTGVREQEGQFACWPDFDLSARKYSIQEHLDLGFSPKDSEEGTISIPLALVDILRARRLRHPAGRLIFPSAKGQPNGHLLRIIKGLSLRAGTNCGYCTSKKGLSCATAAVCKHIILHKLRKTYASKLSRNGVPVRTIQRWLRHSDLGTTLGYLADEDDEGLMDLVNTAFPVRLLIASETDGSSKHPPSR